MDSLKPQNFSLDPIKREESATKFQSIVRGHSDRKIATIHAAHMQRQRENKKGVTFNRVVTVLGEEGSFLGQNTGRNLTKLEEYAKSKKTPFKWISDQKQQLNIFDECGKNKTTLPASLFANLARRTNNTPFQVLEIGRDNKHVIAINVFSQEKEALQKELRALKSIFTKAALDRTKEIEERLLNIERIAIVELTKEQIQNTIDGMESENTGSSKFLFDSLGRIEPSLYPGIHGLYDRFTVNLPDLYLKNLSALPKEGKQTPFLALERYTDPSSGLEKARTVIVLGVKPCKFGGFDYKILRQDTQGRKYLEDRSSIFLKNYQKKLLSAGPTEKDFHKYIAENTSAEEALDYINRKERDYQDIKEYTKNSFDRGNSSAYFSSKFYEAANSEDQSTPKLETLLTGQKYKYPGQEQEASRSKEDITDSANAAIIRAKNPSAPSLVDSSESKGDAEDGDDDGSVYDEV